MKTLASLNEGRLCLKTTWRLAGTVFSALALLIQLPSSARADPLTANVKVAGMYTGLALLGYRGGIRNEDTGVIQAGQAVYYDVMLYRGTRYAFFAAGDQNIADLDILVYDLGGNLVAADEDRTELAQAFVIPGYTGLFRFWVKNYRGNTGYYATAIATD